MDERLNKIEEQKNAALNQSNTMYNNLLADNQNLYNQQQAYANQYETTQNDILDKQLAYNTDLIEQQKQTARENARVEQNKAKNDYMAYTNPYGLQAETFASQGLLNSGVSETAKLGGYNTYQNRLSTANKTMQDAIKQYDNDINQARLNNDVSKAQNALKKLELQLGFAQDFYSNKSNLLQNQFNNNQTIDNNYYNRYQTEYSNIQEEKAREEAIRQWEAQMAYQKERDKVADEQWAKEYALSQASARRAASAASAYGLTNGSNNNGYEILSTDGDGWSKTNLTQKLSNGSIAEVFRSPQGELLYWNPNTNGWATYGTTTNTVNAQQYQSANNSNTTYKSTYTPNLSSNTANNWVSTLGPKALTLDTLNQKLAKGISERKITEDDAIKIYKSYGINV